MSRLTRGILARRAGVNVQTVRYYEKIGLLPPPRKGKSGYGIYREEDVERIRAIKKAQELGFSLKEIADLLSLGENEDSTCDEVLARTARKIREIEEKVNVLLTMKRTLERISRECEAGGSAKACPFLEALRSEGGWE